MFMAMIMFLAMGILAGCATPEARVSPVEVAETDYLDEHALRLKDELEKSWFLSGSYYLEGYIPEKEYNGFYVTRLNRAEFELGSANYHIMHCMHDDFSHLAEVRRHIKNVEDILKEVTDRLGSIDFDGVPEGLEGTTTTPKTET